MFVRDVASSNSMMSVYIGNYETLTDVLVLFNQLVSEDVRPDGISLVVVLSACAQARAHSDVLDYGRGLHGYLIKVGLGRILNVNNSLLDMYIKNKEMHAASNLYSEMGFMRDVVSDTILIRGYVQMGLIDSACNVFDQIVDTDVVVWNSLIYGFVRANRPKTALELFKRMVNEKVRPDEHTMASVLTACGDLSDLQFGRQAHNFISREFIKQDVLLKTALIEMYFKCRSIEEALVIFYKLADKFDVFTWSAVIEGLAKNGYGVEALSLFNQMEKRGIEPNEVTFVSLLSACRCSGLVKEGSEMFRRMVEVYNIECKVEHFGSVVNLLSKSGYLHQAEELIELLPPEQRLIAYKSLLSACIDYSDFDLGRTVASEMARYSLNNHEVHILLSNFYALAGQWEQVAETRRITKEFGTRKEAGKSSVGR